MSANVVDTAPAVNYAGMFDRLERSLTEELPRVARERASAPRLLAELLSLPVRERRRRIVGQPRFQLYALAAHALERAAEEARTDLGAALILARTARLIASRVCPRRNGWAAVEDLRERALAVEANLLLAWGGIPIPPGALPALRFA
jgi:hypothetical protein